jgi:hypothetical protein
VTSHPIDSNLGHWWLTTQSGSALHAVPGEAVTWEQLGDAIGRGEQLRLRTACGRAYLLTYPGPFSRMGEPRCSYCCKRLGIGPGLGAPCNEAAGSGAKP